MRNQGGWGMCLFEQIAKCLPGLFFEDRVRFSLLFSFQLSIWQLIDNYSIKLNILIEEM